MSYQCLSCIFMLVLWLKYLHGFFTSVFIINKDFKNNKNYYLNYVSIVVNNFKEELKNSSILL